MRSMTFALVGVLAVAVAFPAVAAKKNVQTNGQFVVAKGVTHSWGECNQQALGLGLVYGQSGMADYMRECTLGHPSTGGRTR